MAGLKKLITIIIKGFLILLIIFNIISITGLNLVFNLVFTRYGKKDYSGSLSYRDIQQDYKRTVVNFKSQNNTLKGYIYGIDNTKGLVVFAHGMGGCAESFLPETMFFVDQGWRVFSFDCTGSNESEGRGIKGFPQSVIDLRAALSYIQKNSSLKDLPIMLFGHSWGGYAVAAVLNYNNRISAVVSVSGFNSPMEIMMEQAEKYIGPVAYLEYPYVSSRETLFFGKMAGISAVDGINRSHARVMLVHGINDNTVSYKGASIISHRNEITNPNVIYKTCSLKNRNGHRYLFVSDAAYAYRKKMNAEYKKLSKSYGRKLPADVVSSYYKSYDYFKASELDDSLMKEVNLFYESSLKNSDVKVIKK